MLAGTAPVATGSKMFWLLIGPAGIVETGSDQCEFAKSAGIVVNVKHPPETVDVVSGELSFGASVGRFAAGKEVDVGNNSPSMPPRRPLMSIVGKGSCDGWPRLSRATR